MARYVFERFTKVIWIPTWEAVPDISAPTVAAIATGVDLSCFIFKDGLQPGGSTNKVEGGSICTNKDSESIGSVTSDFMLKMFRDNAPGGDTAWDLANWGDLGVIIVRRGVLNETAFAAAQPVETYQAQMGEPIPHSSAANTRQGFDLGFAVEDWDKKALVAA